MSFNFTMLMNRSDKFTFFRLAQISCAISFGLFGVFIWSIQEITPSIRLELTAGSPLAFLIGAVPGWFFWKTAWQAREGVTDSKLKRKLIAWFFVFALFTFGAFAFGLRGHSREKLMEFAIGTGTALIFLTIAGSLFFMVARYFHSDETK